MEQIKGLWAALNQPVMAAILAALAASYVMTARHEERLLYLEQYVRDQHSQEPIHEERCRFVQASLAEIRADINAIRRELDHKK